MNIRIPAMALLCSGLLGLSACGGGGDGNDGPELFQTQIVSDSTLDGDIERTSPNTFVITQGMSADVQNTFVGIDPTSGTEFRTFLTFPLTGNNGVPGDAVIDEAFLEIRVDFLDPQTGRLPVRVDLVSLDPPTLIETDYDRSLQPALATIIVSPDINRDDVGTFVPIDVTTLMQEAQRRGLNDFQVRILEDIGPAVTVLMSIDNPITNRRDRAPLLTVTYF